MNVIALKRLKSYWEKHPDAKSALKVWYQEITKKDFEKFSDLTDYFPRSKYLGDDRMRFPIRGNNYRLIVKLQFNRKEVYIKWFGTHADYDKIDALTASN